MTSGMTTCVPEQLSTMTYGEGMIAKLQLLRDRWPSPEAGIFLELSGTTFEQVSSGRETNENGA